LKIIHSLQEIGRNFALTIGNFDGVHLGHRYLLKQIKNDCSAEGLDLAVLTFNPHPLFVLKGSARLLINSYEEREDLLASVGVDYLSTINFNRDFSNQTPEEFIKNILFLNKAVKKIFLGHDFVFGANKSGNIHDILEYIKKHPSLVDLKEKDVILLNEKIESGLRVSSSEIRKLLQSGKLEEANVFLGRAFFIKGRVIKGHGRGKKIGFPTANISFASERLFPALGVYATKTYIDGLPYVSVTNIGINPTFDVGVDVHIETHILDFDRDIYGEEIKVEFHHYLRGEEKFGHVHALIEQIEKDKERVKRIFE
jgi:riboflavin kinase / FMN adenylyltransferase